MIDQLPDLPEDADEQLLASDVPGWDAIVGPMLSMYRGEQSRRELLQQIEVWLDAEKRWKAANG